MIAEDRETDEGIAATVRVSRRTIEYWKKRRDVRRRIGEILKEVSARMAAHYERFEWLQERKSCLSLARSRDSIVRNVALARLREMGAL